MARTPSRLRRKRRSAQQGHKVRSRKSKRTGRTPSEKKTRGMKPANS